MSNCLGKVTSSAFQWQKCSLHNILNSVLEIDDLTMTKQSITHRSISRSRLSLCQMSDVFIHVLMIKLTNKHFHNLYPVCFISFIWKIAIPNCFRQYMILEFPHLPLHAHRSSDQMSPTGTYRHHVIKYK